MHELPPYGVLGNSGFRDLQSARQPIRDRSYCCYAPVPFDASDAFS
jgi:hypothetical protein